jgi:hypothetical protein
MYKEKRAEIIILSHESEIPVFLGTMNCYEVTMITTDLWIGN